MDDERFVGKRILLVGSNPDIFEVPKTLLGHTFASVIQVDGVTEALQICSNINPDIILFDHPFSKTSGTEIMNQILALLPNKSIIVLSENMQSSEQEEYLKLGCVECLKTPVDPEQFMNTIKRYLPVY